MDGSNIIIPIIAGFLVLVILIAQSRKRK